MSKYCSIYLRQLSSCSSTSCSEPLSPTLTLLTALKIQYCGKACQKSDWEAHKIHCKSYLGKESWQPSWIRKNQPAPSIGGDASTGMYGGKHFLWGNSPAMDVLQLQRNEGINFTGSLNLLFAGLCPFILSKFSSAGIS